MQLQNYCVQEISEPEQDLTKVSCNFYQECANICEIDDIIFNVYIF